LAQGGDIARCAVFVGHHKPQVIHSKNTINKFVGMVFPLFQQFYQGACFLHLPSDLVFYLVAELMFHFLRSVYSTQLCPCSISSNDEVLHIEAASALTFQTSALTLLQNATLFCFFSHSASFSTATLFSTLIISLSPREFML
jgi:hypothetical protein